MDLNDTSEPEPEPEPQLIHLVPKREEQPREWCLEEEGGINAWESNKSCCRMRMAPAHLRAWQARLLRGRDDIVDHDSRCLIPSQAPSTPPLRPVRPPWDALWWNFCAFMPHFERRGSTKQVGAIVAMRG